MLIANAVDDEATPINEEHVLFFAHSEWIGSQTGLRDPSEQDAELTRSEPRSVQGLKAYYTSEFERVMNYHRMEAIRWWWQKDHSAPAKSAL